MFAKVVVLCAAVVLAKAGLPVAPAGYGHGYGGFSGPALAAPVAKVAAPGLAFAPALASPAYAAPYGGAPYGAAPYGLGAPAVAKFAAGSAFAGPFAGGPLVAAPAIAKVAKVAYPEIPQPYSFGYNLNTEDGATLNRQEVSDEYNHKKGSYGYTGPDGIYRQVNYVADDAGFRATIETNEHGTANQNPASVSIAAAEPPYKVLPAAGPIIKAAVPVAASIVKAAPAVVAPAYAAPLYGHAGPAYGHHAGPAYGHHAGPAYGHHAAAYGHGFGGPAVVKAPLGVEVSAFGGPAYGAPLAYGGHGLGGPVVKAPLAYGAAAPVAAYSAAPVYASNYAVKPAVPHTAPVYSSGKYGYY